MSNNIDDPPWKISTKGACWCWYDEITDQELLSIIKPDNGFKIEHNGYEYSVIVNDNGTIPVFKRQTRDTSNFQNLRSSKNITTEGELYMYDRSSRMVDIRLVPLDKIHDTLDGENWEISEYNPVCKTKDDEIVVILVKRQGRNSKTREASQ